MMSELVPTICKWPADPEAQESLIQRTAKILAGGGLVVFPTDTVYGIAADPLNAGRRGAHFPGEATSFGEAHRPTGQRSGELGAACCKRSRGGSPTSPGGWPGALTIVLECSRAELGPTIALRWPDHEVPTRIAMAFDSPIATTSANLSSLPSPRTAEDVLAQLPSGYELLIDGGETPGGVDSTVIDFSSGEPKLLRRGGLERSVIARALGSEATSRLLDS